MRQQKQTVLMFVERKPEHYVGDPAVIIRCRPSEVHQVAYDIRCALIDGQHPQLEKWRFVDA